MLADAVEAPRWLLDARLREREVVLKVESGFDPGLIRGLSRLGHAVEETEEAYSGRFGHAGMLVKHPRNGRVEAMHDPVLEMRGALIEGWVPARMDFTSSRLTQSACASSTGSSVMASLVAVPDYASLYLALTVGWILGTQYTSAGTAAFWPQLLWQFGEFTAIVAAPLWFGSTVLLTAGVGVRAGWLALGLGVLLPWPVLPLLVVGA